MRKNENRDLAAQVHLLQSELQAQKAIAHAAEEAAARDIAAAVRELSARTDEQIRELNDQIQQLQLALEEGRAEKAKQQVILSAAREEGLRH